MDDSQINLAIAKIEYSDKELHPCESHVDIRLGNGDYTTVDYCNNWEDIGPIIEREKIDLAYDVGIWSAYGLDEATHGFYVYSYSPTKSACLCYLRMKGVEV